MHRKSNNSSIESEQLIYLFMQALCREVVQVCLVMTLCEGYVQYHHKTCVFSHAGSQLTYSDNLLLHVCHCVFRQMQVGVFETSPTLVASLVAAYDQLKPVVLPELKGEFNTNQICAPVIRLCTGL